MILLFKEIKERGGKDLYFSLNGNHDCTQWRILQDTLKNHKTPQTLHYHSPWPFPSLFFANWSRTLNFSSHFPVSEWNAVSRSGRTSGSCIENLAAHQGSQCGGQRGLGTVHLEADADILHKLNSVLRTGVCKRRASTFLSKSAQERPLLFFFFFF